MIERPHESTDVLIVGGGPSGLVSALLLAKLGIRSIVVEKNAFTDEHPKAHELNARSIEILSDAGIDERELAVESSPLEDASRILFCRTINEEVGRIDLLGDPRRKQKYADHLKQSLPYLNVSQSEIEKILVAHVRKNSLIDLRFGHRWESCDEFGNSVHSMLNTEDETYEVDAKYLLACDGASSPVRRTIGIEMEGPARIQSFVNAFFKLNLREKIATSAKLYWILHPEYAGTLVAHHIEKRWVYAAPVFQPWEQPEDYTPEVMRARIEGALGFEVPDLEISSLSTWHMTAQIAKQYRCGRVFLIGDAAHRFPPTGGLGMNTGIADAHNLCWKLSLVLSGRARENLLETYETERRPIAQDNCNESLTNYEKIFEVVEALGFSRNGMELQAHVMSVPPIRWLPAAAIRTLRHCAAYLPYKLVGRALQDGPRRVRVQAAIANQINHFDRIGLDIGYVYQQGTVIGDDTAPPDPADKVSEYVPTTCPGSRLPHAWVSSSIGQRSTHDYLGYNRFTLLVADEFVNRFDSISDSNVSVIGAKDFPESLFRKDDAILVRPDGHVAWRAAVVDCNVETVTSVLNKLLAQDVSCESF